MLSAGQPYCPNSAKDEGHETVGGGRAGERVAGDGRASAAQQSAFRFPRRYVFRSVFSGVRCSSRSLGRCYTRAAAAAAGTGPVMVLLLLVLVL